MGQASRRENPFQPGAGARPPLLAGRDAELSLASAPLDSLEAGNPPSYGFLLVGPRGNGKTCLLYRIADEARSRGMRAESLSISALGDPESLRRELLEKAHISRTRDESATSADATALLASWVRAEDTPLVILLDEAYAVRPTAGRLFFDAIQAAIERRLPFLWLVAGTPDAPRRLQDASTFTEHALRHVRIGRLERPETRRALTEPARSAGLPMRHDAAAHLARESHDYPYFIQLLGRAAWSAAERAGGREIKLENARAGTAATHRRITWLFAGRFNEAREHKIERVLIPLARLLRDRGGRIDEDELGPFLNEIATEQSLSGDETWLLDTLSDLGVLWRSDSNGWEIGIPNFADYLLALPASETGGP